jgi:hypothetical protein
MARIPIDTGVATTTTVKAAFDGINTMTSELYAALGDPANMVALTGQALRRTTAYTGAPTAAEYSTFAFKFRMSVIPSGPPDVILGSGGHGITASLTGAGAYATLTLAYAGGGTCVPITSGTILTPASANYQFLVDTDYTVHVATSRSGTPVNKIWVNGVAQQDKAWGNSGTAIDCSAMTQSIFSAYTEGLALEYPGYVGFFWYGVGTNSSWYITDPLKFYNAGSVHLGPAGQGPNTLQPLVFFGGTHIASEWLAGTNFGSGGNFTLGND